MSATRPYYLLGQQRLDRLAEQVHRAFVPLGERWWPSGTEVQIIGINNFYADNALTNSTAHYFLQQDERWLALFGNERAWLMLAEGWLGCNVATMTSLVQTLIDVFLGELFFALSEHKATPTIRSELPLSQLPAGFARPGAGTLLIELSIAGTVFQLLASAALWPQLAEPSIRRTEKKLIACHTALGACRVHLDVTLPVAQITLTHIATLAAGDFLNLGHDLSGEVVLQGRNIALTLPAAVGQHGIRKAIQLTGIKNEKTA